MTCVSARQVASANVCILEINCIFDVGLQMSAHGLCTCGGEFGTQRAAQL